MASSREQQLVYMLEHGHTRDAIVLLNWLDDFRFTALFRFDGDWLRYVEMYDREDPQGARGDDLPVVASYCQLVRESGAAVEIRDSLRDARVDGHPKRDVVRSYCSAPLFDDAGRLCGTVCHFDADVRPITPRTADGLAMFARLLREHPGAMAGVLGAPADRPGLQPTH
ncbi:GAF domain-containing protein [Lysobacter xanthus]